MDEKPKHFLKLTFEGGRFVDHTLPVDVVGELATLQALIHNVARALFFRANPARHRVSVGFIDAAKLHLAATEANCYSIGLSRAEELGTVTEQHEDSVIIEQAREVTLEALRCAAQGEPIPEGFPPSAYEQLSSFGKRLRPEEWLAVSNDTATKVARVDQKSRTALSKAVKQPLSVNADLDGEVDHFDDAGNRFWLRLDSGQQVEIPLNRELRRVVLETLVIRPIARMRIGGQMHVTGGGARLVAVDDLEIYDSPHADEVIKLWERLDSFDQIREGWLDGIGAPPTAEARTRAREVLARLLVSHSALPRPRIFPTPDGGVQAEWVIGAWAADLKFYPGGEVEGEAVNADTGEEDDRAFGQHEVTAEDASALATWLVGLR